jgi:hypothetical protein
MRIVYAALAETVFATRARYKADEATNKCCSSNYNNYNNSE